MNTPSLNRAAHERHLRHHPQHLPSLEAAQAGRAGLNDALVMSLVGGGPGASIYLPTHRSGSERRQDHIRLKNLIADLRRQAPSLGARLDAFQSETEADAFWAHPTAGLAWFGDDQSSQQVWLPETMPELAMTGAHRHIKPLLPLLAGDGPFHLLELHQHGVRLHAGSKFGMHHIALDGIPTRVEDLQHAGDGQRDVEARALNTTGGTPLWFGGAPELDLKNLALRYFRAIDQVLRTTVKVDQMPLVLAGVGWLLPLYRQASRHPRMLAHDLAIDTAAMSSTQLHALAWEAAAPCYDRRLQEAIDQHAAAASDRRVERISDILVLASTGRCGSLLVAVDRERWGTYTDGTNAAEQHATRQAGDEDLLNVAAVLALRTGAQVWAVPAQLIPAGHAASALIRY